MKQTPSVPLPSFGNPDAIGHVTGRSLYLDDLPVMQETLHLLVLDAPIAHGKITRLETQIAAALPDVVAILTAKDIPGENQIGGIFPDEPLFAESEVHFQGQPVLLIVAETAEAAEAAKKAIVLEIAPLPVITDPREAYATGHLLSPSRTFKMGDPHAAFEKCAYVFSGIAESGGQEHLYLETQGAYAYPTESGGIKVHASTQGPTAVQRTIARVLGLPMNRIEVDVTRLGGGFGGKEDQASLWGALAALAAWKTGKAAKLVPHRMQDLRMTGKRHPYSSDYKIGLDKDLRILAYEATYYQNGGAAADLSPAILERTLFHATNSYAIPHVSATAHSCKTHLPPNTAFRGFGGPQGMFVIEAAIHHAATELGVPAFEIQEKNLVQDGYEMSYGQVLSGTKAIETWRKARQEFNLDQMLEAVTNFNATHPYRKKGLAIMPICFGISFTNTMMNQARALVHVYSDGSVSVSTGAIEMGQGVNAKMVQVAAKTLGIHTKRIRLETTNTGRVANTSPSAASATADLNGKAVLDACQQIQSRLLTVLAEVTGSNEVSIHNDQIWINQTLSEWSWEQLIQTCHAKRINLSAKGHYATPEIHFDKTREKGHPFAYHVYGTAITLAEVDCIRGTYGFDAVKIIHDGGNSMNPVVDIGQVEGGLVQGMGWMTMEEVVYDQEGKLRANALSTYKIPDIYAVPHEIVVHFLEEAGPELALFKSKAVGEPPLMYGIGAYFALTNAITAFNPDAHLAYAAPMTPEKVLLALYSSSMP
ncbi:MAG: molybdopterin-dependent oxidoreductase [Bacteroidetes Order II. Incertae sedis bacterium]|nr:molybdopterin-dependent oxidoreductase [Bacteroidetes Order II. bacterium]